MAVIQVFHVSKYYHERPVLDDVSLKVEKGEFCCIVGPNGAGKTTLLRLLYCQDVADRGQIVIQNLNITKLPPAAVPSFRQGIGFVFQDFRLIRRKTVLENVGLALMVGGRAVRRPKTRVNNVLTAMGLDDKKHLCPPALSTGEQQRVCIARAVVGDPQILLADEPTGSLDSDLAMKVCEYFQAMNTRGTTVVVTTQDHKVADRIGTHRIHLAEGRVAMDAMDAVG